MRMAMPSPLPSNAIVYFAPSSGVSTVPSPPWNRTNCQDVPARDCADATVAENVRHTLASSARVDVTSMESSFGTLRAELTEMVIRVEVRPAQPRGFRHAAEYRVRVAGEAATLVGGDSGEQHFELDDVRGEVDRPCPADGLVQLRGGPDACRPTHRRI